MVAKRQISIENYFDNVAGADTVSNLGRPCGHEIVFFIQNEPPDGTEPATGVTVWGGSAQGGHLVVKRQISIGNNFPCANVVGAEPVSSGGGHVVVKRSIVIDN